MAIFSLSLSQRQRLGSNPLPWVVEASVQPLCYCIWTCLERLNINKNCERCATCCRTICLWHMCRLNGRGPWDRHHSPHAGISLINSVLFRHMYFSNGSFYDRCYLSFSTSHTHSLSVSLLSCSLPLHNYHFIKHKKGNRQTLTSQQSFHKA